VSISSPYRARIHHFGENSKGIDPDSLWAYHADAMRSGMRSCRESLAQFLVGYKPGSPVEFTHVTDRGEARDAKGRLRELKELFEEGLITPEVYEHQMKEILDEM
jgi:hypothetical protein